MYLSSDSLSKVLGTQMLSRPPPVVHEGDDLGLQRPGLAQLEVGVDLVQPRCSDHHRVAPRTVKGRVVVDPAKCSLRNADGRVRMVLDQKL